MMKRAFRLHLVFGAAVIWVSGLPAAASAGDAARTSSRAVFAPGLFWVLENHYLTAHRDGERVAIRYDDAVGGHIGVGDPLFEGQFVSDDGLSGTAYSYAPGCDPVAYPVSGRVKAIGNALEEYAITLTGAAPVRGTSCAVTGLSTSVPEALLVLGFAGTAD